MADPKHTVFLTHRPKPYLHLAAGIQVIVVACLCLGGFGLGQARSSPLSPFKDGQKAVFNFASGGRFPWNHTVDRFLSANLVGMMDINRAAPVQAVSEIYIDAPISEVWGLLVRAREWPDWNPEIKRVTLEGDLEVGRRFKWGPAFPKIRSEVVAALPESLLAWTGTMLHLKAVHVWRMSELNGGTLLITEESLEGACVGLLFGKRKLEANLKAWLQRFKTRAEARKPASVGR